MNVTVEDNTIDKVKVALRIRPLLQPEIQRGCRECIKVIPGKPQVQIQDHVFTYNYVFAQHITQQEFYDTAVKGLIGKLFQGYNVPILAYGQTGSGKTFTMGNNYSGSDGDLTKLGVIPQAVTDIFDFIETHGDNYVFKGRVSYMELYQEQCYDLLSGKQRSHSIIKIREDNKGVVLPGLSELQVTSTMETLMALEKGSSGRVTGSTAMNQASSQSHAIFTITIANENQNDKNLSITSKFHFVDLAGLESITKTKSSGQRFREGVKINQGLLALGTIVNLLGDGTSRHFISYRNSTLTGLLQDSLGGNSLTLLVACVSPVDYNLDETVSTLRYADRARCIRNKPVINQDEKAAEIVRLNNLVNELRFQLLEKLPTPSEQNNEKLQEELASEKVRYTEITRRNKQITEHLSNMLIENTNLSEKVLLAETAKDKFERKLNELTEQCNQTIENLSTTDKLLEDEAQKTCVIDYIRGIKNEIENIYSTILKTNEELIDHKIKLSFVKEDDSEKIEEYRVLNEDQTLLEEQKRTMRQVALNQVLQELNLAMATKASKVQAILANNKGMIVTQNNLRENQEKLDKLETERYELLQQLQQTTIISESQRSKVTSLEAEISELKKKCQQEASIIKTKERNKDTVAALNAELQTMIFTKGQLLKQMREESEKFRKWKSDNERELLRLRIENCKRVTAMAKMVSLYAKLQNEQKRKMEEVVAVDKRHKAALNQKLRELNRALATKASKVKAILANNKGMIETQNNLRENQEKLDKLETERYELLQQLQQTTIISESQRSKVTSLEAEISELKKKCQQEASIIKTKERNEATVAALNAELQTMIFTKGQLLKQMREESEKFRKWKSDNERELLRLRIENCKRVTAMAKMVSLYAKLQNEQKRKMEEVVAVDKRHKAALNQKLQELNRALATKVSKVKAILANNKGMIETQNNLRENQEKLNKLETERYELLQQLQQTTIISESQRSKVTSLEAEISELKKKCQQEASIIKTKERNEATVAALNAELQTMIFTKGQLLKQMREESEKFRKWKSDNERELLRLRIENCKRVTAMTKMVSLYAKLQNEQKRKMEEVVAVDKRHKAALNQKLQELNRALATKVSKVKAILANNKGMIETQNNLRENQEKLDKLETERYELLQQLQQTTIISESQRSKVTSLEAEISELKKKCQQEASIIKTKERNKATVAALNAELQTMIFTKGQLLKQMREESEKFRKWKSDNERELLRLRIENCKRVTAMAKMVSHYAKLQNEQKRKMEEVVAVDKRHKEAREGQQQSQMKCNAKGSVREGAIQQYIEQELEVHLSIFEGEHSVGELEEYSEQIERMRNSTDNEENTSKKPQLENDLTNDSENTDL